MDGTQGLPNLTLERAEKNLKQMQHAYDVYKTGKKPAEQGRYDADLDEYYARLADLINHKDLPAPRRAELEIVRKEVLKLRRGFDI